MKKLKILIILLLIIFLSGCHLSNQKLAKKMIEMYSEDKNYVVLFGYLGVANGFKGLFGGF